MLQCIYADCCDFLIVMLNVVMPSVVMLSVIMLSVVMLSVVMLSVVMLSVVMLSVIMLTVVMLNVTAPFLNPRKMLELKQGPGNALLLSLRVYYNLNGVP